MAEIMKRDRPWLDDFGDMPIIGMEQGGKKMSENKLEKIITMDGLKRERHDLLKRVDELQAENSKLREALEIRDEALGGAKNDFIKITQTEQAIYDRGMDEQDALQDIVAIATIGLAKITAILGEGGKNNE